MKKFEPEFIRRVLSIQRGPNAPVVTALPENPFLKRFRKHQFYKAALKCYSVSPVRRRVTYGRFGHDLEESSPLPPNVVKPSRENCLKALDSLWIDPLREKDARDCVVQRASLRKNIETMGDSVQWLKNKPVRSAQEEKHLKKALRREKLEEVFGMGNNVGDGRLAYSHFVNNAGEGDKFVSQETLGLHILDEYLMKNNEDLYQFLSSLDPAKTGKLNWEKIGNALGNSDIPIKTFQIFQGIAALKCDEGLWVNYSSFCKKMENFRKYKYRRLFSENVDFCDDLVESLESSKDYEVIDYGIRKGKSKAKLLRDRADEEMSHPREAAWSNVTSRYLEYTSPKPRCKPQKSKFWPGAMLDKIQPCYMPEDKQSADSHHPIFKIVRSEKKAAQRPTVRLPPFTRYKIHGDVKKM